MVIANPYLILLPLILLALGGYICSWLFALSEDTLVRVVTDFFMPMLVFYSLYTSSINLNDTMRLGGAVSFVLLFLLIASLIYCHVFNLDKRAFLPPIVFINTGFLGIPLMGLWGGAGEVNQIVIYDQIQTFYIFYTRNLHCGRRVHIFGSYGDFKNTVAVVHHFGFLVPLCKYRYTTTLSGCL